MPRNWDQERHAPRQLRSSSSKSKSKSKKWPEKGERKLAWVSAKKAVELVEEPGVVPLLRGLTEFEDVAEVRREQPPKTSPEVDKF